MRSPGRKHARRVLPDQQAPAAATIAMPDGRPPTEVAWLEPYPDSYLEGIADDAPNPEARYTAREAVQLAFVAAIQQLPPRQRAALLLCDVLGWTAAEAATLLGGSTASINSALQRARETLAKHYPRGPASGDAPARAPTQQKLLDRYLRAWEGHDIEGFVALLKEDATFTMPPWLQWYAGREAIGAFFAMAWKTCGGVRLVPTAANGQPASRSIHPHRRRRTVGCARDPGAHARAGDDLGADVVRAARRRATVRRVRTAARPAGMT